MKPLLLKVLTCFFDSFLKNREIGVNKNTLVKVDLECGLATLPDLKFLDNRKSESFFVNVVK